MFHGSPLRAVVVIVFLHDAHRTYYVVNLSPQTSTAEDILQDKPSHRIIYISAIQREKDSFSDRRTSSLKNNNSYTSAR